MKLITWNINGIRAIERKGFAEWFEAQSADWVCLQEIKAQPEQLSPFLQQPPGYFASFCCAHKPGYSGLVTYSKTQPLEVVMGMGFPEVDLEGRILRSRFEHFTLINAYMPHARRDLNRKDFKLEFCQRFLEWVAGLKQAGHKLVICGDYNVSHHELDLTNARANQRNAGFLPEERAWMDQLLALGFHDIFRDQHPGEGGHYTWWSNRKGVRERNVGWRIDYICIDESLVGSGLYSSHQDQVLGSDHCPVALEWR